MALRIPTILNAILEATAAEAAAKAQVAALRKVLDEEARRRYAEDGAAPTWKAHGAGAVRFDAPGDWTAAVADEAALGSYLAERHPDEVLGVIYVTASDLTDALQALGFIGVTPVESRTEVRPTFLSKYLEGLLVDVEEQHGDDGTVDRTIAVVDPATGELVDGVTAQRTNAAGKLVVTLDRARKAAALEAATSAADALVLEATGQAATPITEGKVRTLDEALAAGVVRPASELEPADDDPAVVEGKRLAEEARARIAARTAPGHRRPYVGEGADGARRSAQIDREEADCLDLGEQRDRALASAARWDAQAADLEGEAGNVVAGDFPQVEPDSPLPVGDNAPGPGPFTDENGTPVLDRDAAIDAVDHARNREELRRFARAKGVNPGGAKGELIVRLLDAGITVEELTA